MYGRIPSRACRRHRRPRGMAPARLAYAGHPRRQTPRHRRNRSDSSADGRTLGGAYGTQGWWHWHGLTVWRLPGTAPAMGYGDVDRGHGHAAQQDELEHKRPAPATAGRLGRPPCRCQGSRAWTMRSEAARERMQRNRHRLRSHRAWRQPQPRQPAMVVVCLSQGEDGARKRGKEPRIQEASTTSE